MIETLSSLPFFTFSKTSLVYLTAPDSGELLGFIMNVEDQSGGRPRWGQHWVSYPLWNAKSMILGHPWVPKKM